MFRKQAYNTPKPGPQGPYIGAARFFLKLYIISLIFSIFFRPRYDSPDEYYTPEAKNKVNDR